MRRRRESPPPFRQYAGKAWTKAFAMLWSQAPTSGVVQRARPGGAGHRNSTLFRRCRDQAAAPPAVKAPAEGAKAPVARVLFGGRGLRLFRAEIADLVDLERRLMRRQPAAGRRTRKSRVF